MIWFFIILASILLFTGLDAASTGNKTTGIMLTVLGAVTIATGAGLDIYLGGI